MISTVSSHFSFSFSSCFISSLALSFPPPSSPPFLSLWQPEKTGLSFSKIKCLSLWVQKTEARKGKTWNNHIIKPPKQLFLSICCLEQKQEVGRKVEKRARSQARRRGGKSFQMKIQLFVSFFSCTQQQNIHKFLLLYRSIILLLFYFILCPSWTARGQNHLAMCCIIPAHARLIKVDSNTKCTVLRVHWNNSYMCYMWDKLLCSHHTWTNTFYRRLKGQIHFS